jgi:hypothetical protein
VLTRGRLTPLVLILLVLILLVLIPLALTLWPALND